MKFYTSDMRMLRGDENKNTESVYCLLKFYGICCGSELQVARIDKGADRMDQTILATLGIMKLFNKRSEKQRTITQQPPRIPAADAISPANP